MSINPSHNEALFQKLSINLVPVSQLSEYTFQGLKGFNGASNRITPFTKEVVPVKVERVANLIKDNVDALLNIGFIRITRKEAHRCMECRTYVGDNQILNIFKDKLSICMREDVYGLKGKHFKGGIFQAGWERDLVTKEDGDRLIYLRFTKYIENEIRTISQSECVYVRC